MFSIYLSENNIGPIWLSVRKIEGIWYKANMEKLHKVDLEILNENESDGECMILGKFDGQVLGKIVDCAETYSVRFSLIGTELDYCVFLYIFDSLTNQQK